MRKLKEARNFSFEIAKVYSIKVGQTQTVPPTTQGWVTLHLFWTRIIVQKAAVKLQHYDKRAKISYNRMFMVNSSTYL